MKNNRAISRRLRLGGFSAAMTAIVVAGLVVVNIIAGVLVERYDLKVDITAAGAFAFAPETLELLDAVEADVNLYVLATEKEFTAGGGTHADYFGGALEVIKLYPKKSGRISLQFVDTVRDPAFLAQFSDLDAEPADVIVSSGERSVLVPFESLFNVGERSGAAVITSLAAEPAISGAILTVTTAVQSRVAFTAGHEETEVLNFQRQLGANGYLPSAVKLSAGAPDAEVLAIVGPQIDFTAQEIAALEDFLTNGGDYGRSILYLPRGDGNILPNIEAFLQEWGIALGSGLVLDTDVNNIFNSNPYFAYNDYTDTELAGGLVDKSLRPVMALGRPIGFAYTSMGNRATRALLSYFPTAVVRPADAASDWTPADAERVAYPSIALSTGSQYAGGEPRYSRVAVFASELFLDDSLLSYESFMNSEYALKLMSYLTGRASQLSISAKSIGDEFMSITTAQSNVLSVLFLGVLPLLVFGCGAWVFFRRRAL